jgi:hypothetical protein
MIKLAITASLVKTEKGRYVAHADELPITTEAASTQRGAIKNLKSAVLAYLQRAAERGRLTEVLLDAGYFTELLGLANITLKPTAFNTDTVSIGLTGQLVAMNKTKRRSTGDERRPTDAQL